MGGSYYERPIETTTSTTGASQASQAAMSQRTIHPDCAVETKGRVLTSDAKQPIIICFDVTGSMAEWPQVIYDKMPMLYGQIMSNGYVRTLKLGLLGLCLKLSMIKCQCYTVKSCSMDLYIHI